MTNTNKIERIEFIDSLKGFAIFLVVWGHSIQYLKNNYDCMVDPVFEFIYSFHMPLFFMVSGFFFKSSLKLNLKDLLVSKSFQLIFPCFIWSVIFYFISLFSLDIKFNLKELGKIVLSPSNWPFWFLKELFLSYVLMYLSYKVFKKNWLVFSFSICFVLLFPIYFAYQRFLFPMFVVGVILKEQYSFFVEYYKRLMILITICFIFCLLFWKGKYTIYETFFPPIFYLKTLTFNFTNFPISLFRLIIGISGSLFFFGLFQKIYNKKRLFKKLEWVGMFTLNIYILQTVFYEILLKGIINFKEINNLVYSVLISPFVGLLVILISMSIVSIIKRFKFIDFMLFGGKIKNIISN